VSLNYPKIFKALSNSSHSARTTRAKGRLNEEIQTNVTNIIMSNNRQTFLVITDRWNGATSNCGGITSLQSDINSLTEE